MYRMMHRNLAAVFCAVVLAIGLAACGGSSNNKTPATTPDPPPAGPTAVETAIKEARTAAMAASGKAKTASDNAGTSADEAEAAILGVVPVFIPKGEMTAKSYADAARTAADMAKAEYDKAKMESDKAAATSDLRVAAQAEVDAEAAQAKAEAQAAQAAEKAKMAKDAAAMEVRHVEGLTYRYGDTTITADAPKASLTTGGETVVTGKIGNLNEDSQTYAKKPVQYVAATGNKPEVVSRTGFVARTIPIGYYADSEKSRLFLVDKYVSNTKAVKAYRKAQNASGNPINVTAPVTAENPFGSVTAGGKSYKVMRAESEFYVVDTQDGKKFDKTNAWDTINRATKDSNAGVGIYYYNNGSKDIYLLRTGTSGTDNFTYRQIFVYDVPDFPEAKPYEHMNYGRWDTQKSVGADLGIAFVQALPGKGPTPAANLPGFGSATYRGHASWQLRQQNPQGAGGKRGDEGTATTTVDFGKSTIRTDLFTAPGRIVTLGPYDGILATLQGTIDGNGFSGSKVTNVNAEGISYNTPGFSVPAAGHRGAVGLATSADGSLYEVKEYRGQFFGPNAEEVGGVFYITSKDKKKGELLGSFGGRR